MKKNLIGVETRYRVTWHTEEARCTLVFSDKEKAEQFAEEVHGEITYIPWNACSYDFYMFLTGHIINGGL